MLGSTSVPSALIDKPFPEFSLPRLDNAQLTNQEDLLGRVTLVNVWASWCVSCRVEHPYLQKLADAGMRVVGINYKDTSTNAQRWLNELGNPYAWNIVDHNGRLGIELGVTGAPENYLIDAQGVIRYKHVGIIDDRIWREKFLPVIKMD